MYKISCDCGRSLNVSAGQSGTSVTCECGKTVLVPSWRELVSIQETETASGDRGRPAWGLTGWSDGFFWLGMALVGISAVASLLLYINMPRLPDLHRVPPAFLIEYLKILRTGVDGAMPPFEQAYIRYERIWQGMWDLVSIVAILGALLVLGILLAEWWERKSQVAQEEDIESNLPENSKASPATEAKR